MKRLSIVDLFGALSITFKDYFFGNLLGNEESLLSLQTRYVKTRQYKIHVSAGAVIKLKGELCIYFELN